jgi:choline dehydrogenase-like flavoprotein
VIRHISALTTDSMPNYDVCIVGSGPAGMTVARDLGAHGLRIAVLESGSWQPTPHADALRHVESEGVQIKTYSRERVLGGASRTWAGLSAPLDPIDVTARPWVRVSGWPIPWRELTLWYRAAATRYQFPSWDLFAPALPHPLDELKAHGDLQPVWRSLDEKIFLASDPPQRFGQDWPEIWERAETDVWLDATVTSLETDAGPDSVSTAVVRSSSGTTVRFRARVFVLAAGGIENARLLLCSRSAWPAGLGNATDQVGRYLMNHPKGNWGLVRFRRPISRLPLYFGFLRDGVAGYAGLRLTESEQTRLGVLNSYVRLEPIFDWTDSVGVDAFVALIKQMHGVLSSWKRRQQHAIVELRSWAETGDDSDIVNVGGSWRAFFARLGYVARDLPNVLRYATARLTGAPPTVTAARVRNFMEMEPESSNRVELSQQRDALGVPVPRVVHRPTDLDQRSLLALHDALAEELERTGIGRFEGAPVAGDSWPINLDASHHMGTTRMGSDPATSVVTSSLQLHGIRNVYVAGASVFPTSGCANPTFTIVALAMRLAAHLAATEFAVEVAKRQNVDHHSS